MHRNRATVTRKKLGKMLRPRCLNGAVTTNAAISLKNMVTLSRQCCRVPGSENISTLYVYKVCCVAAATLKCMWTLYINQTCLSVHICIPEFVNRKRMTRGLYSIFSHHFTNFELKSAINKYSAHITYCTVYSVQCTLV